MELKYVEHLDENYCLRFEDESEGSLIKITVRFSELWRLTSKAILGTNLFGRTISFNIIQPASTFPFDLKNDLQTIPIHMPNPYGRFLFKSCFQYFIKETNMPAHITTVEQHPGYPLLEIIFNSTIVREELIKRVIDVILNGIESAKIEGKEIDKETTTDDEDIDSIDDAKIFEFELDDELKGLMKQPVSESIEDLPERKDSHD